MKDLELHINNLIFNTNQALLLSGVNAKDFSCKVVIPANIENKDLVVTKNITPLWLIELELLTKKHEMAILVIENLDSVYTNDQLKFLGLIKHRSISGFEIPNNSRIVVTCKNIDNIADKIKSNCCVIKAV